MELSAALAEALGWQPGHAATGLPDVEADTPEA
jgi:hypothetical protein